MRLWIKIHCSWPPSYDPYPQNNHRIHEPTGSGLAQELSISIAAIAAIAAIALRLERSQGLCHRVAIASPPAISRRCFRDIYHLSLWKREVSLFVQMKELQKKTGGSLTGFGPWLWHWSWIFCRRWESHKAKNCPWVSKWAIRFCMVLSYTPDCRSLAIDKRSSSKPRRRNALLSLDSVIHLVNSGVQHKSNMCQLCKPRHVRLDRIVRCWAEGFVINPLDARMDLAKDQEPHLPWSTS